jgi:hypothetical protein
VVKRFRLVFCLLSAVIRERKDRISSCVIDLMSLWANSAWSLERMNW